MPYGGLSIWINFFEFNAPQASFYVFFEPHIFPMTPSVTAPGPPWSLNHPARDFSLYKFSFVRSFLDVVVQCKIVLTVDALQGSPRLKTLFFKVFSQNLLFSAPQQMSFCRFKVRTTGWKLIIPDHFCKHATMACISFSLKAQFNSLWVKMRKIMPVFLTLLKSWHNFAPTAGHWP